MQLRMCVLLLISISLFACSDAYYIEKWRDAKTGEAKIDAAEAIVDRKLLLNLTRERVEATLGPGMKRESSIAYLLHKGGALQPMSDPITAIALLVCDFDRTDRITSCMIQKD